jgi:hypothetical protein
LIGKVGRAVRVFATALVVAALLSPRTAAAAPAFSAGWDTGVCGGDADIGLSNAGWCNALRGDVLFFRERSRDFGVGPALRLGTARFDDLRLDAGVTALIPLFESFPLVLEAGPHLRNFHEPGIYGSAFFGLRSFNHYGAYEAAAGIAVTAERTFVGGTPSALWITARIDGSWLLLPGIFLYNALK